MSSADILTVEDKPDGRSLINIRKMIGPRTVPCGTPERTGDQSDEDPFNTTRCRLPVRKSWSHMRSFPLTP